MAKKINYVYLFITKHKINKNLIIISEIKKKISNCPGFIHPLFHTSNFPE